MAFAFISDPDTSRLFEVVVWCLEKYFGHDRATTARLVEDFYARSARRFEDDDYHHEGAYPTAARIHYFEFMRGDPAGFDAWKAAAGHKDTPREALEYFRAHYFEQ